VPADFIRQQIAVVMNDIGADVIKVGMLGDSTTIDAVCESLATHAARVPVVLDPVMIAKGGHALLASEAVESLRRRLLPSAAVVTPNLPEAEALTGQPIRDVAQMRLAATALLALGVPAVLLKGGHLESETVTDLLATADGIEAFSGPRIESRHTHGTGCTLASAVAAGLAQGMTLHDAVVRARIYVRMAMQAAPGFGQGHGPLDHSVTMDPERVRLA
jgi:hydroxymethylpyrimidine/phosphomethylpyrimidine kinase